jgi:hypothetical protein
MKRNVVKRKRTYGKPTIVEIGKQAIPKQLANTLRYSERVSITLNGSGLGQYVFSANGLFDPNITGVGHQPMYFDQISALYNHYLVLSSSCSSRVVSTNTFALLHSSFGDDDGNAVILGGPSFTARERPGAYTKFVSPSVALPGVVTTYFSAAKVFGGDPKSKQELRGNNAANPTEQWYYTVIIDGGAAGALAVVEVEFDLLYNVFWDEFTSIGPS